MTFDLVKVFSRHASSDTVVTRRSFAQGDHSIRSHAEHHKHAPLPFLASPVDPEALRWAAKKKRTRSVQRSTTVAQFEADQSESQLAHRIFRKQHEASTLELFFDLFFVANLAVFTTQSAHTDLQSFSNYVGFFSILWTTWFHIAMFDVRFYVDSVFTRLCKFAAFGIMVSFVGLTSMYDAVLTDKRSRAFHGIALLMFGARVLFVVQYSTVLYFVRVFDKTLVPMLLTMFVYIIAGFGFLATWLHDRKQASLNGAQGAAHVRTWYIIMCVEAIAIISISCVWRILSFKHTHLVERVGLLSLIIMGEGIIGLVKSTFYTIQGTSVMVWHETGIVAAAVLLIYLIYVLYFDNVDHHRFGTIAQQFWILLHFPAHLTILLTVEGSTALLIWNSCRSAISWVTEDMLPNISTPQNIPGVTDPNMASWIARFNETYAQIQTRYYYKDLAMDYYKTFDEDMAKLKKINSTYGSADWAKEINSTLMKVRNYYEYFLYQNFGAEGPYYKIKMTSDYAQKVQLYEDGFKFTLMYFYVAAGALLFVLAFLYWFGRTSKTKTEWTSIGIRILAGMCLPIMIVSPLTEVNDDSFRFTFSYLLIPIVSLSFLLVIIVDNIVKAISDKHYTIVEERRLSRMTSYDLKMPPSADKGSELADEDSSYEMHRSGTHDSHELVQSRSMADDVSLIKHAQRMPTVTFEDTCAKSHMGRSEYGEIAQDEEDVPEYSVGDDLARFRTSSVRRQ